MFGSFIKTQSTVFGAQAIFYFLYEAIAWIRRKQALDALEMIWMRGKTLKAKEEELDCDVGRKSNADDTWRTRRADDRVRRRGRVTQCFIHGRNPA